jgi:hypothetical protein
MTRPVRRRTRGAVAGALLCTLGRALPVEARLLLGPQDGARARDAGAATPEAVVRASAAIGLIRWKTDLDVRYAEPGNVSGTAVCSGTLVGIDLLLTAGHCLDAVDGGGWVFPKRNGGRVNVTPAQAARELVVEFHARGAPADGTFAVRSYPVAALLEHRPGGLDWALLGLQGEPGRGRSFASIADSAPPAGGRMFVVDHPEGGSKRITAGVFRELDGDWLKYEGASTAGGSSGAGLFDPDGRLMGIHVNGHPGSGIKIGIAIDAVLARLKEMPRRRRAGRR